MEERPKYVYVVIRWMPTDMGSEAFLSAWWDEEAAVKEASTRAKLGVPQNEYFVVEHRVGGGDHRHVAAFWGKDVPYPSRWQKRTGKHRENTPV